MHQGMRESQAGKIVGYWRGGRPIRVAAGGSTPPEPIGEGGQQPQGVVITPPPPAPEPPRPVTAQELQSLQAQWRADSEQALRDQEERLRAQFQEQLTPLQQREAERQAEIEAANAAAAEAERLRLQSEETAAERAERMQAETQAELARMREELAARDEIVAREQRRNDVERYRGEQLAAHAEEIHPSQVRWVQGYTREEIDASIQNAIAASNEFLAEVENMQQQQQGAAALAFRQQPLAAPTGAPPMGGPIEGAPPPGGQRTLTAADIRNMTDAEYAANRDQLLGVASGAYKAANGYQ
jgi:hypothetical protein